MNDEPRDVDKPRTKADARAAFVQDTREGTNNGKSDVSNEESFLISALHLLHRKQGREHLTLTDHAILKGAASLFESLAEACTKLSSESSDSAKSTPKTRRRR